MHACMHAQKAVWGCIYVVYLLSLCVAVPTAASTAAAAASIHAALRAATEAAVRTP